MSFPPHSSPNSAGTLIAIAATAASAKTMIISVRAPAVCSAGSISAMPNCFQSRSECSRANSFEIASCAPIRLTATRNASSSERPPSRRAATWSRRWSSSSATSTGRIAWRSRRKPRHCSICASSESATTEGRARSTMGHLQRRREGHREPDVSQRRVDRLPLLPLLGELRATLGSDAVVLALASRLRGSPLPFDVTLALEPVQHRIEHPVGPLELPPGQLAHPLQDRVAVRVPLGDDREDQRSGRGSYQVLVDFHREFRCRNGPAMLLTIHRGSIHGSARYVNTSTGQSGKDRTH